MLFVGTHNLKVDTKNRFRMPTQFRGYFENIAYISIGFEGSIEVRNEKGFEIEKKRLEGLNKFNRDYREFKRVFFANTYAISFDTAGRITIPQTLKENNQLQRDIVIVGVGENLELWAREKWDAFNKKSISNIDELSKKLEIKN